MSTFPLTFGSAYPAAPYPGQSAPLSYGSSLSAYGSNPTSIHSGAPVAMAPLGGSPNVPLPPAVPAPMTAGVSTMGPAPVAAPAAALPPVAGVMGVGRGDLRALGGTDALGDALAGAAGPMSWSERLGMFNPNGTLNFDNLGMIAKGIGAFGGLYSAFQQNRMASDALDFQKDAYRTNLRNSVQSYNSALEDRIRSRYAAEGRSSADVDRYLDQNRLRR